MVDGDSVHQAAASCGRRQPEDGRAVCAAVTSLWCAVRLLLDGGCASTVAPRAAGDDRASPNSNGRLSVPPPPRVTRPPRRNGSRKPRARLNQTSRVPRQRAFSASSCDSAHTPCACVLGDCCELRHFAVGPLTAARSRRRRSRHGRTTVAACSCGCETFRLSPAQPGARHATRRRAGATASRGRLVPGAADTPSRPPRPAAPVRSDPHRRKGRCTSAGVQGSRVEPTAARPPSRPFGRCKRHFLERHQRVVPYPEAVLALRGELAIVARSLPIRRDGRVV